DGTAGLLAAQMNAIRGNRCCGVSPSSSASCRVHVVLRAGALRGAPRRGGVLAARPGTSSLTTDKGIPSLSCQKKRAANERAPHLLLAPKTTNNTIEGEDAQAEQRR